MPTPPTARPTVSVVVPTYRRRDRLAGALAPLLADRGALEVVVVVDGADDGSLELLQEMAREDDRVRPLWRENGGEGAARQTGLEHARGDVVLFLDDDVLAGPDLPSKHAAVHGRDQGADQGAVVLGYMPTRLPARRRPGQFATYLYREEYEQACRRYESGEDDVLAHLWAGNMSLRRRDALAVGLVGDDFRGLYHADQDLGLRCAAAGLRGVFDRGLASEHVHVRPLRAYVRDARAQGAGRVRLAAVHPGVVAPPTDAEFLSGLPLAGALARLPDPALGLVCRTLVGLVRLSGLARAYAVESLAAKLLRRLEQVRGAREERVARARSQPLPD